MFNWLFGKQKKKEKFTEYDGRLLFILQGCSHCRLYHGVVEEFNMQLQPDKRIQIVDVTDWWQHGVNVNPIVEFVEIRGTPTLYLGGKYPQVVEGATTRHYLRGFLKGYFKQTGEMK